jgi:hypothetical protein
MTSDKHAPGRASHLYRCIDEKSLLLAPSALAPRLTTWVLVANNEAKESQEQDFQASPDFHHTQESTVRERRDRPRLPTVAGNALVSLL